MVKDKMQPTNPNAHTDVEKHREENLTQFFHDLTICDLKFDVSCETSMNFVECGV